LPHHPLVPLFARAIARDAAVCRSASAVTRGKVLSPFWHRSTAPASHDLFVEAFENFVVVDRIGGTLELVSHLVGSNRRPTGQRGALLWFRTGSNVVVPNAFRLLSIPTT
jgi:hypothetical protein